MRINEITEKIIGAAIEVHRVIGPGLLERCCGASLCRELKMQGLRFARQVLLPVRYKDIDLDCGYRMDLVVEESVIVEIKAVEGILPIHEAQLLTYLRLTGQRVGLLINFNVPVLKQGVRRLVNNFLEDSAPSAPLR